MRYTLEMQKQITSHDGSQQTVRVGPIMAIPSILSGLGLDPAKVLAEAGLAPNLLDDPDNRICHAARNRLISLCVARTGCDHFGLLIGEQVGLSNLGLIGYLASTSHDVETALNSIGEYLHLHVYGATAKLRVEGEWAVMSYAFHQGEGLVAKQICDGAIAAISNMIGALCGADWRAAQVRFVHRRPKNIKPFQRIFNAPLVFDATQYAIVFPSHYLTRQPPGADPELRRLLHKQIEALATRIDQKFSSQVRQVLQYALLSGQSTEEQIAALFSLHTRTLRRRLEDCGTSFRELVEECRFEIARQWLETSDISVSQIAAALDYSDPSAFTRAFRRWSGVTPTDWRAERA